MVQNTRLETSKLWVNAVFHRWCTHETINKHPPVNEIFEVAILRFFFVLLARNFELHENTSSSVFDCLRLLFGAPGAPRTPHQERALMSRNVVACEEEL